MAENENKPKLLWLQSSPHVVRSDNVPAIMSRVIIALLPATVFGVVLFGISALLNIVVAVASAVIGEALFRRITRQDIRIKDCSAVVTGLLLALVLPPSTPLWMTALGALFAIIVAKEFFGGLGGNVFNPALIGRAFLLMSFPAALTTWLKPTGIHTPLLFNNADPAILDAFTTATPLGILKEGVTATADGISHASGTLGAVESSLHAGSYGDMFKDLFLGNYAGCIGETSVLLILLGGIFLLITKTIDWRAPVGMLASAFVFSLVVGLNPIFTLLSGGLVFGAVFMATDYTTTPVTGAGKLIFGIGAGLIVVLIRKFGNYPEGVMFSILIMNAATPFLNGLLHKKYGFAAPKKGAKEGAK
ncbi:MAG: RnfABCDGE type electron transport complex subunit D [Spirochaetaceae bacterium]|jgi:electron transport complex protein RnfD|nr:RnfABCDGE type electron transport complex subunit D [Spirochaetaceae bacterium]